MDPVSLIEGVLVAGAAASAKDTSGQAVKDAFRCVIYSPGSHGISHRTHEQCNSVVILLLSEMATSQIRYAIFPFTVKP